MTRRPLPLLAMGAGLIILLVGVVGLQRVFVQERNDARRSLADHQAAVQGYAIKALHERCRFLMEAQRRRMKRALRDPLQDASGLYYSESGHQLLPRPVKYRKGKTTAGKALYLDLLAGRVKLSGLDADDPWRDRLILYRQFRTALGSGKRRQIERSFRRILTHRSRFLIASRKDIAYQVALLDHFSATSSPDPALMDHVLRTGLVDSRGHRTDGLQVQLLEKRDKLTQSDFDFFAGRIARLSEASGVRHDDFLERTRETPHNPIQIPETLPGPMLLAGGKWYVEQTASGSLEGVTIAVPLLVAQVASDMQDLGLLHVEDRLSVGAFSSHPTPLLALSMEVVSSDWDQSARKTEQRFWLKTGLGVVLGALASIIVVLVGILQAREARYLTLKTDFVSTVSHELRTPLASIRLMAETLERRLGDTDGARDYPLRILREVDSLTFLVENILSFNRLDRGKWKAQVSEVALRDLVEMLREELPQYTSVPVRVLADTDLVFRADPDLMKLLFLNLGSNACKYNESTEIRISIDASSGDGLRIRVSDNGIGIPTEDQTHVFTEFYRGQGGVSRRGFGLGLAICARIMSMHDGAIRISGSSPRGTVIELEFPQESVQ